MMTADCNQQSQPTILIGESDAIEKLRKQLSQVAASSAPVLLEGETGTGKEICSKLLHELSGRKGRFVPVNLTGLPSDLVAGELFGHDPGAYTGATLRGQRGFFEEANQGTILLDEIGDYGLDVQVKLLRVIQEGTIVRLGSKKPIKVDVRIISATNRNLEKEVKSGRFRADLFFRLQAHRIALPPLREREGDIGLLASHFLARCGPSKYSLDPEDIALLCRYSWPGNVRQLETLIVDACCQAEHSALDIAAALQKQPKLEAQSGPAPRSARERIDRDHLIECAQECHGNITAMAERLNETRSRILWALGRENVDINQFRPGRTAQDESTALPVASATEMPSDSHITQLESDAHRSPQAAGKPYDPAWYVARPEQERDALEYLASPGTPVVLWGPRRFGKTTLGQHLIRRVQSEQPGCRVRELNLDAFAPESLVSLDSLLRQVGVRLLEAFDLPVDRLDEIWSRKSDSKGKLSRLIEQHILPLEETPLILSIDRADSLVRQSYSSDFFALLRAWAESGHRPEWAKLRLLLSISTRPSALTADQYQSPFNLTPPIVVDGFNVSQLAELTQMYGLSWGEQDRGKLQVYLGGHPYLLRIALCHAARCNLSVDELTMTDSRHEQIFDEYIQDCRQLLQRRPELVPSLLSVMQKRDEAIEPKHAHELHKAGILVGADRGKFRLRGTLWERLP